MFTNLIFALIKKHRNSWCNKKFLVSNFAIFYRDIGENEFVRYEKNGAK